MILANVQYMMLMNLEENMQDQEMQQILHPLTSAGLIEMNDHPSDVKDRYCTGAGDDRDTSDEYQIAVL